MPQEDQRLTIGGKEKSLLPSQRTFLKRSLFPIPSPTPDKPVPPSSPDLDIRRGKRLDSFQAMKSKKVRRKEIDAVFEICEAAGMTKREAALAILGVYAKRGQLGPHMLAAYQGLAREERMGLPRLIL
jgi:hypothetical protein